MVISFFFQLMVEVSSCSASKLLDLFVTEKLTIDLFDSFGPVSATAACGKRPVARDLQ